MFIQLLILIGLILIIIIKQLQIIKLEEKIERLESSNLTLKRVMSDEGLIPNEYVK